VKEKKFIPVKALIYAFLLAGTLDIAVALIQYNLKTGNSPDRVLVFIASGVFGDTAFSGGAVMATLGLFFHYVIAFIWTFIFYKLYPAISLLRKNMLVTGLAYGIFIWLVMNLVVVPLSNTPEIPFKISNAITGIVILMLAVGLPISFIIGKHYPEQ
jgi:hypothetical protein